MTVYARLGVRTLVNARGNATLAGGTLMEPEVVAAMAEAARSFARIGDLQEIAGERIAELTGAEAGYVTSGAAAGLTLGAAAMLAGPRPGPDGAPPRHDRRTVGDRRPGQPPQPVRPPRARVRGAAGRVRRRERRHGRRHGRGDRPGHGRRVLPRPGRGARPADRGVRRDRPRARPAGPRRRVDEPAAARQPATLHGGRRRPRRVQWRQDDPRPAGVRVPRRPGRPPHLGRAPAAGHGRAHGDLGPSRPRRERRHPAPADPRHRPVDEDRQGGDRRAARRPRALCGPGRGRRDRALDRRGRPSRRQGSPGSPA